MEIINHKLLFKSYFIWYIIANGPHVQLIKYFHTEKKGETKSLSLDWYQLSTSYTSLPVLLIKGTWIDGATDKAWHMGLSWATVRKNLAWNDQSTLYICQLILSLYQPPSQVPWRTFSCTVSYQVVWPNKTSLCHFSDARQDSSWPVQVASMLW